MKTKKKQLEDWEVSIIRAMLAKGGYSKQEILAYFSRPDRSINQARVSEIEAGNERYNGIVAASEEELDAFLTDWNKIRFPSNPIDIDLGPVHPDTLNRLFTLRNAENGMATKLAVSETDTVEGKKSFNWGSREKYSKTLAGFANNRGGYILFGVEDGSFEVLGIKEDRMEHFDVRKANQYLSRIFSQSLRVEIGSFTKDGKSIGVMYAHPSESKPIICKVDDGLFSSGAIYFRYPGETRTIQAPELETLLQERDKNKGSRLLEFAHKAQEIGVDNTALLNLVTGLVEGKNGKFFIDEKLLSQINFIKEGTFDEKDGAPALRILGELQTLTGETIVKSIKLKENISERDIIEDFYNQLDVENPTAYIEQLCHIQPLFLPVYYYIYLAKLPLEEAVSFLNSVETNYPQRVKKQIERISAGRVAPILPKVNGLEQTVLKIYGDSPVVVEGIDDAREYLKALRIIDAKEVSLDRVLSIFKTLFTRFGNNPKLRSEIRYAIADIDLRWFRPLVKK
ncbi:ATP-binding protein [Emcibacter sp.]|uniref:ATP-binding protein n=1 Tax=Emcibacter sp. TaxID=1979954 RepID=UPI002AA8CE8E|nr:ATP-binding protein [Emcibacter sp.]